ncbi:MAG: hypothetical protein ISR83_08030 [Candidatus Marinimicrobia bacterium]|nr:hypothetical protein [Candidatus Neomarinimicrobiota bacterium]
MTKKIVSIIILTCLFAPNLRGADLGEFEAQWLKKKDEATESSATVKSVPKEESVITRKSTQVIPVKALPGGWVFRDELLANWGTNLPAVISIIPDSSIEVVYQDEKKTTKDGIMLPIKRASVTFDYTARLTQEQITLSFVNVDFIYSTTNSSDSHFILEKITKRLKLRDGGFPKLTSDDVIKFKVLMEYGTPREFDGVWHIYNNSTSGFRVRKLDDRNLKVEMTGLKIKAQLEEAIDEVYSKQGIEHKKRLMMEGIDL